MVVSSAISTIAKLFFSWQFGHSKSGLPASGRRHPKVHRPQDKDRSRGRGFHWPSYRWVLQAENASMAFLPSEGWEVYVCDDQDGIEYDKPGA